LEDQGSGTGPAICNEKGMVLAWTWVNDELHAVLLIVQSTTHFIPADIVLVPEKFNIHRLYRRGATMMARGQGVDEATIEMNN